MLREMRIDRQLRSLFCTPPTQRVHCEVLLPAKGQAEAMLLKEWLERCH